MSKKIISLLLCLCMVLSSAIITGAADFDETEIKEESVPAAETPVPAEESSAPAEAQEELPAQAPEAAGQETGEQPAQESKIPAGFKEQLLEVCVDDSVVVQVGGYMPEGARLEVKPLSDEAMAYVRSLAAPAEGEGAFYFAYDIKLVVGEGEARTEYSPADLGVQVIFYFKEQGLCFGGDTAVYHVTASLDKFPVEPEETEETGETAAETEEADESEKIEEAAPCVRVDAVYNSGDYILFNAAELNVYAVTGTAAQRSEQPVAEETTEKKELALSEGGVTVAGELPEGAELNVTPMADPFASAQSSAPRKAAARVAVQSAGEETSEKQTYTYDVKLSLDGQEIQPDGTVRVSFKDVAVFENGYVEVYHILDSADAILAGKGVEFDDPGFAAAFPDEAALAAELTGKTGVVYVECFSTEAGTVGYDENGYVCVDTTSFSTYYIVSGNSANGTTVEDVIYINDGENNTYYVAPGTTLRMIRGKEGNSEANWVWAKHGTNTISGISVTTNNGSKSVGKDYPDRHRTNPIIVKIPANATPGTRYELYTRRDVKPGYHEVKTTFIVQSEKDVISNTINNNQYGLYLAVLYDSRQLPGEPCLASPSSGYGFFTGPAYGISGSTTFAGSANGYVLPEIVNNPNLKNSADGTNTVGIIDTTGERTKAVVRNISWDTMLQKIAEKGNFKATDGTTVTTANKDSYEILPYVVKLQTAFSLGWHVDCYIVPKANVTLSYNANFADGVTANMFALPSPSAGVPTFNATVGTARVGSTDIKNGTTITVSYQGSDHPATFKGWNTRSDGKGTMYQPGSTISVSSDTVLYAQWGYGMTLGSGYLEIYKRVVTAPGSKTAPTGTEFTMSVAFSKSGNISGRLYDHDGTYKGDVNSSSFKLKDGQYARFSVPKDETFTVTETSIPAGFTAAYDGNGEKIVDGATSTVTVTNTYNVSDKVSYTVTHMLENLSGFYEADPSVDSLSGVAGQPTEAKARSYPGFTAKPFNQLVIKNGVNVEIYYTRNTHSVTYSYTGSVHPANEPALPAAASYKYGADVSVAAVPSAVGYTFDGWKISGATASNGKFSMPDNDVTLTGSWTAKTDVGYTVKYVEQGTTTEIAAGKTVTGRTFGTTVRESAVDVPGFTAVAPVAQDVVLDAYNKVVTFYYTRNTYEYVINHLEYRLVGSGVTLKTVRASARFGDKITVAAESFPGFTYKSQDKQEIVIGVSGNEANVYYTRNSYRADAALAASDEGFTSTSGSGVYEYEAQVSFSAQLKPGYDFVGWFDGDSADANKLSDSIDYSFSMPSRDVKYYAKSVEQTVSYSYEAVCVDTVPAGTVFGTVAPAAETVGKATGTPKSTAAAGEDFTFIGWFDAEDKLVSTDPAYSPNNRDSDGLLMGGTFCAKFEYTEADYTVKHMVERLDGSGYDEKETETGLSGKIGSPTEAAAKDYEGFTPVTPIEQKTVAKDDSDTVEIYYTRNEYTITYNVVNDDPSADRTVTYKYGAPVEDYLPEQQYFTFNGWYTFENDDWVKPDTMPAGNISVYGLFERQVASLTISKGGMQAGENAIFVITGEGIEGGLRVKVPNGGSVTVNGLCVGATYTVTEESWSYKYGTQSFSVDVTEEGKVYEGPVQNTLDGDHPWLSGETSKRNVFDPAEWKPVIS